MCSIALWIHKGYYVVKKLVWNNYIKALIQFFDCKITFLNSQNGNTKGDFYSKIRHTKSELDLFLYIKFKTGFKRSFKRFLVYEIKSTSDLV